MSLSVRAALDGQSASLLFNGVEKLSFDANGVYGGNLTGEICWFAFSNIPKDFLLCNGSTPLRASHPTLVSKLIKEGSVTWSYGTFSSLFVNWPNHTISLYDPIEFPTGLIPTGISASTKYYAVGVTTAGFFLTLDPATPTYVSGSFTAGLTSNAVNAPWGRGNGTTTFTLPNILDNFVRGWNPASARVFGSFQNWATAAQSGAAEFGLPGDFGVVQGTSGVFFSHGNRQPNRPQGTGGNGGAFTLGISIGTPGAVETRSSNIALLPCIKR